MFKTSGHFLVESGKGVDTGDNTVLPFGNKLGHPQCGFGTRVADFIICHSFFGQAQALSCTENIPGLWILKLLTLFNIYTFMECKI